MFKRYILLALFSLLAIFLFSGCSQESPKTDQTDINKQEEANNEPAKTQDSSKEGAVKLSELQVHYIDVGQGDSTLIQYSHNDEEYTILIDAGNWTGNEVVNYLNAQKISQIDIAIGTHPDADHIGQLDKVINTFEVGEVWLSGNTSSSQTFQRLLSAIDSSEVDYYEPRMGDEFEVGPLEIAVLYPKTISENDNEESISLTVTYGDVRFIFTGDATTTDELKMIQSGLNVEADILHLGHHGSSTSTHPSFLKAINPSVAIYSAGMDNTYGHPHDEVVSLVQSSGIRLYGTDVHGTILVSTDGKDYKVLTKKDGTISPESNRHSEKSVKPNSKQEDSNRKANPAPSSGCIDINTASLEELQNIIHIGPSRAAELIELRPFSTLEDLSRIKGIGPTRIEEIRSQGLACVRGG